MLKAELWANSSESANNQVLLMEDVLPEDGVGIL